MKKKLLALGIALAVLVGGCGGSGDERSTRQQLREDFNCGGNLLGDASQRCQLEILKDLKEIKEHLGIENG